MRNGIVIGGTIVMFAAAFVASQPAQTAGRQPSIVEPTSVRSSALYEGIRIDSGKSEKPIRVILPSPFETASRTNKEN